MIELLVTVAIVGILAALLLPTLSGAKRSALAIRSVSNVKQLGLGMTLYAQDHGQLPRDPREPGSSNWVHSIAEYVGGVDGVANVRNRSADTLVRRVAAYPRPADKSVDAPKAVHGPNVRFANRAASR